MIDNAFAHIDDSDVPALPVLLGSESEHVLDAVLGPQGGSLRSSRITQIRYTPGSSIVVRYRVDVGWRNGRATRESLVAASGISVPPDTPVLASDGIEVAVWTYPNDPFLPGLAAAASRTQTKALLSQLGVDAPKTRLRLRAYRPGRRAVVEVNTPNTRIFLKVVRPVEVARLQETHRRLAQEIPVPHSHGWNEDLGLVALQAMPGKPLRKALESGTRRLPEASQFTALLDAFPAASDDARTVTGPHERAVFHARLLSAVTPELSDRVRTIVERSAGETDADRVPVHGDFHSSQLLVRDANIVGLIDVDTAGVGSRTNDLAVLLAHMSTVGLSTATRRRIDRYGATLIKDFDALVDPRTLRRRVAAAIVGLATGPFRVNMSRWPAQTERRIALAERWIASANDI